MWSAHDFPAQKYVQLKTSKRRFYFKFNHKENTCMYYVFPLWFYVKYYISSCNNRNFLTYNYLKINK